MTVPQFWFLVSAVKFLSELMSNLIRIWRRETPKKITVVLNGGLGNQLFQYFAGLYVAQRANSTLIVDATFSQRGRTGHSDWINVLGLPGTISKDTSSVSFGFLIALTVRLSRGLLARLIKSKQLRLKLLRQYRSPIAGFDSSLDQLDAPITIIGYFQTWRYYQWLKEQEVAPEVSMGNPSDWYRGMQSLLERENKVLGLHVRRGDYVWNPEIGILSTAYYHRAMLALKEAGVEWDAVWVFSDDAEISETDFMGLFSGTERFSIVKPPFESHSFESLALMAQTSALIIANSTFSWWAATLGDPRRKVVCPESWFADMEDPLDLCPPDWIRVKSAWATPQQP